MLLTKNLKMFIPISTFIASSGVILANLLVNSTNISKLPVRGDVERSGLSILGIALIVMATTYLVGRYLYKKENDISEINLSIIYHLVLSAILLTSISAGYIISNVFWVTDILWVLALIMVSLAVHIFYKRSHIRGMHKKKLFV